LDISAKGVWGLGLGITFHCYLHIKSVWLILFSPLPLQLHSDWYNVKDINIYPSVRILLTDV